MEWRIERCVNVCIDWLKKCNMAECYWWVYTPAFIETPYRYQGIKVFYFWSITKVSKLKACIDDL